MALKPIIISFSNKVQSKISKKLSFFTQGFEVKKYSCSQNCTQRKGYSQSNSRHFKIGHGQTVTGIFLQANGEYGHE